MLATKLATFPAHRSRVSWRCCRHTSRTRLYDIVRWCCHGSSFHARDCQDRANNNFNRSGQVRISHAGAVCIRSPSPLSNLRRRVALMCVGRASHDGASAWTSTVAAADKSVVVGLVSQYEASLARMAFRNAWGPSVLELLQYPLDETLASAALASLGGNAPALLVRPTSCACLQHVAIHRGVLSTATRSSMVQLGLRATAGRIWREAVVGTSGRC